MKTITPYLVRFALVAFILAIVCRVSLSYALEQKMFTYAMIIAIGYGLAVFVAGWIIGRKDSEFLPIYDVGFRFHLTTYIIHNGISESWFLLGFNSGYEHIQTVHQTAIFWGFFLLMHLLFYLRARKNSIDDLDKTDLFE